MKHNIHIYIECRLVSHHVVDAHVPMHCNLRDDPPSAKDTKKPDLRRHPRGRPGRDRGHIRNRLHAILALGMTGFLMACGAAGCGDKAVNQPYCELDVTAPETLTATSIQVGESARYTKRPSAAVSGDVMGAAFWEGWFDGLLKLALAPVAGDGTVGEFTALAVPSATDVTITPLLLPTDAGFSLSWLEMPEDQSEGSLWRVELDGAGNVLAGPFSEGGALGPCRTLSGASRGPGVGLVCNTSGSENYFAVASADGAIQGSTRLDGCEYASRNPAVVWSGSEYLVFYSCSENGERSGRMVTLDATGIVASSEQTLEFLDAHGSIAAVWNGSAVDLLWFAYDASPVEQVAYRFATVTSDGSLLREPVTTFSVSAEELQILDLSQVGPIAMTPVNGGYVAASVFSYWWPAPESMQADHSLICALDASGIPMGHCEGTIQWWGGRFEGWLSFSLTSASGIAHAFATGVGLSRAEAAPPDYVWSLSAVWPFDWETDMLAMRCDEDLCYLLGRSDIWLDSPFWTSGKQYNTIHTVDLGSGAVTPRIIEPLRANAWSIFNSDSDFVDGAGGFGYLSRYSHDGTAFVVLLDSDGEQQWQEEVSSQLGNGVAFLFGEPDGFRLMFGCPAPEALCQQEITDGVAGPVEQVHDSMIEPVQGPDTVLYALLDETEAGGDSIRFTVLRFDPAMDDSFHHLASGEVPVQQPDEPTEMDLVLAPARSFVGVIVSGQHVSVLKRWLTNGEPIPEMRWEEPGVYSASNWRSFPIGERLALLSSYGLFGYQLRLQMLGPETSCEHGVYELSGISYNPYSGYLFVPNDNSQLIGWATNSLELLRFDIPPEP